jgi:hypothetical protein
MQIRILVVALILAGCVTTSDVVPTGKDTYMVTASTDPCGNCTPTQIRAAERANAYCKALSKRMVVENMTLETFDISFGRKTTLMFRCEEAH